MACRTKRPQESAPATYTNQELQYPDLGPTLHVEDAPANHLAVPSADIVKLTSLPQVPAEGLSICIALANVHASSEAMTKRKGNAAGIEASCRLWVLYSSIGCALNLPRVGISLYAHLRICRHVGEVFQITQYFQGLAKVG